MKSPCSFLGMYFQRVFSALGRSKSNIIPAFPFTKIYLSIVIEKEIALYLKVSLISAVWFVWVSHTD